MKIYGFFINFLFLVNAYGEQEDEDEHGVRKPSLCEVCKFFALELQSKLDVSGKSKEVIETGHGLDAKKTKKPYSVSELRFIEALQEPHVCDNMLLYNVHKERKGSNRFAKGMSETMKTLHGLVNKGVKVNLGMPEEMWDKPPAEVTEMQRKCYDLVEKYEDEIEDWYYNHQEETLMEYFCRNLVLHFQNDGCLDEQATDTQEQEYQHTGKMKGDKGIKEEL